MRLPNTVHSREHPHPCRFVLSRWIDRGWGELACEYRWESTLGEIEELAHCRIFETIRYTEEGRETHGWYAAPDPPFVDWWFRDPTDGRLEVVGLEYFPATQGAAWDRHKLLGPLRVPDVEEFFAIRGRQEFRFTCSICGADERLMGPHEIVRTFEPRGGGVWRYAIQKHGLNAWMDLDASGYVDDSAHIGFGPWQP